MNKFLFMDMQVKIRTGVISFLYTPTRLGCSKYSLIPNDHPIITDEIRARMDADPLLPVRLAHRNVVDDLTDTGVVFKRGRQT